MPAPATFCDVVRPPRGWLRLDVLRDGQVVDRIDEPNLTVVGYRTIVAGIVGGLLAPPGISQIGFGSSMAAPAFGNSALSTPYLKPLDGVTYPAGAGQAVFAFSLGSAEAIGLSIGEFGLLSPAGVLFARKTRTYAPIVKDINLSLSGTWTIQF